MHQSIRSRRKRTHVKVIRSRDLRRKAVAKPRLSGTGFGSELL